jgi:diketogulonate reductase-like aldo/keto reductase
MIPAMTAAAAASDRVSPGARVNRRRREFIAAALAFAAPSLHAETAQRRPIPASGERIPVVGMGTWLTFDVGDGVAERAQRKAVLQAFFAAGGGMIDSSPMYGRAERVVGELLPQATHDGRLFAATKVWTAFDRVGAAQIDESLRLWQLPRLDLLQVHNLLNWRAHLKTLRTARDAGRTRYIGVTSSHGRKHDEMATILKTEKIDFMQISYSLADASAEPLLDLAAERGVAVIVNRPYDGGHLFDRVGGEKLPPWAAEAGCANWPEFLLKWVLAHPAVTCAIPATRQAVHMRENMAAGRGLLPDAMQRRRMQAYMAAL